MDIRSRSLSQCHIDTVSLYCNIYLLIRMQFHVHFHHQTSPIDIHVSTRINFRWIRRHDQFITSIQYNRYLSTAKDIDNANNYCHTKLLLSTETFNSHQNYTCKMISAYH